MEEIFFSSSYVQRKHNTLDKYYMKMNSCNNLI